MSERINPRAVVIADSNWDRYLEKQGQGRKIYKRISWVIVLLILLGAITTSIIGRLPKPKTYPEGTDEFYRALSDSADALTITTSDSVDDAITITASAGSIKMIYETAPEIIIRD